MLVGEEIIVCESHEYPAYFEKEELLKNSNLQPYSFSPRCNYDFDDLSRNIACKFYESIPAN